MTSAAFEAGHIDRSDVTKNITPDEANKIMPGGAVLWGTNAMTIASRGRGDLAWRPASKALEDEIPRAVDIEAMSMKTF